MITVLVSLYRGATSVKGQPYRDFENTHTQGIALMAVWSKALPLTASRVSPLSGFESHLGM